MRQPPQADCMLQYRLQSVQRSPMCTISSANTTVSSAMSAPTVAGSCKSIHSIVSRHTSGERLMQPWRWHMLACTADQLCTGRLLQPVCYSWAIRIRVAVAHLADETNQKVQDVSCCPDTMLAYKRPPCNAPRHTQDVTQVCPPKPNDLHHQKPWGNGCA